MSDSVDTAENADTSWDSGLKPRERRFCLYYCSDSACLFNAKQAYKKAYSKHLNGNTRVIEPGAATCEVNASKLLRKTKVKTALKKLLAITQADLNEDGTYKALHDIFLQAMYDPKDIITSDGSLRKPIEEIGELSKCIEGIEQVPTKNGTVIKISLSPRQKYLSMMAKILSLIQPVKVNINEAKLPVILLTGKPGGSLEAAVKEWNSDAGERQEEKNTGEDDEG